MTSSRDVRRQVEVLAQAQDGAVTRAQCLGMGMTSEAVTWMLRSGRWQRVHRGVYATHVGELSFRARVSAAVLYCGDGAAASHETAARLLGLLDADPGHITVQVPETRRVVAPQGVRVRLSGSVTDCTARSGWPTRTTVEDTVLDLAAGGSADDATGWLARACQRRLTTPRRLSAALSRRSRHRWRELLLVALGEVDGGAESVLEVRWVLRVERPHGLPRATRQHRAERAGRRRRDDNAYREFRVLVELDGRAGHVGEGVFRDRQRDNEAAVEGWVTLRFGWTAVTREPCATAADLARVLRGRGWQGRPHRCGPACTLPEALS